MSGRDVTAVLLLAWVAACGGARIPSAPEPAASAARPAPAPPRSTADAPAPAPPPLDPASPFPSADELDDLRHQKPEADGLFEQSVADVDAWELSGPFPEHIGDAPIRGGDDWDALLLDAAQRRAGLVLASEAMQCAAREMARFLLVHEKPPEQGLRRFMVGRCGGTSPDPRVGWYMGGVPPLGEREKVLEAWHEPVVDMIEQALAGGPRSAGIAFEQVGDRAAVALVVAARRLQLQPTPQVPAADGWVRLEGQVIQPAEELLGSVTQGATGYGGCRPDPAVRLPRFSLLCPTDRKDERAWISLAARAPGRFLSDAALVALARPSGAAATRWQRRRLGEIDEVADADAFAAAALDGVNRLRRKARLRPLELEPRESENARELAPVYFGAQLGLLDPAYGDLAALGMMAGWQVRGLIRDANVSGVIALETLDVGRWLAEAIDQPGIRGVLMNPGVERIALGPVVSSERRYLAALLATYALYDEVDTKALSRELHERIAAEFTARGLTTPQQDATVETLAQRHAAEVSAGAARPDQGIEALLSESVSLLQSRARGWVLEGSSLADLRLPEELFREETVRVAVGTGVYRPADWPWGRTFALLIAAPEAQMRSVMLRR